MPRDSFFHEYLRSKAVALAPISSREYQRIVFDPIESRTYAAPVPNEDRNLGPVVNLRNPGYCAPLDTNRWISMFDFHVCNCLPNDRRNQCVTHLPPLTLPHISLFHSVMCVCFIHSEQFQTFQMMSRIRSRSEKGAPHSWCTPFL